jgi:HTH-type transcriptional regulator / antitoxin HigA
MEQQVSPKGVEAGKRKRGAGKKRRGKSQAGARYLRLIDVYPLRPIRTNEELDEAIAILDRISGWTRALLPEEQDYLECLAHEIERYEAENVPMPAVSGAAMLRHLVEAREATLSDVAEATGVALSTLSSVLKGKRKLNLDHIRRLAPYFGVKPAVFLD